MGSWWRLIEVCSEVEASRHGLRLLDAIETYEPDRLGRKAKFESYAISKIWQAILDQLRSQDWVLRCLRSHARKVERESQNQIVPGAPAHADRAQDSRGITVGVAEYHDFLGKYSHTDVAQLEARMEAESGSGIEYGALVGDSSATDPQSRANLQNLRPNLPTPQARSRSAKSLARSSPSKGNAP